MTTYVLLSRRGNQVPARSDVAAGVALTAATGNHTFGATTNGARPPHSLKPVRVAAVWCQVAVCRVRNVLAKKMSGCLWGEVRVSSTRPTTIQ
jgi:hypothetical protein